MYPRVYASSYLKMKPLYSGIYVLHHSTVSQHTTTQLESYRREQFKLYILILLVKNAKVSVSFCPSD